MQPNSYPLFPILLVDDEVEAIEGGKLTLSSNGIDNVIGCQDSRQAMSLIQKHNCKIVLLDLSMPHLNGEELLEKISNEYPQISVIIVTGHNDVEQAVQCMKNGAFDYLVKPVEENRLVTMIKHAIDLQDSSAENLAFRQKIFTDELKHPDAFSHIITRDRKMRSIFQYIEIIAKTGRPVLITGETGVGKELLARSIHNLSHPGKPFVPVNIAGLDDNAFSDSLFGHLKGAFTGADKMRHGLIEQANKGSLFLDEIGDLHHNSQVKLLRLLQEKEYFPLGADVPKESTARIIVATNCVLHTLQQQGKFRPDLYFRLQIHHIQMPPLRSRLCDLPLLVNFFLEQAATKLDKKKPTPPRELFNLLASYTFPGNIRELEAMVFEAVAHHRSKVLSMDVFKKKIHQNGTKKQDTSTAEAESIFSMFTELPTLKESSKLLIDEALKRSKGNQTVAAQLLGISRSGLSKAIKRAEEK